MLAYSTQVCGFKPKPSDFLGEKVLSMPSVGGEVKPHVSHVAALRHVTEPNNDVEITIVKLDR
jgi:hypothetical protein